MTNPDKQPNQSIEVRPKMPGFFILYTILALPGFIMSMLFLILLIIVVIGVSAGLAKAGEATDIATLQFNETSSASGNDAILVYDLEGAIQSGKGTVGTKGIFSDDVAQDIKQIRDNKNIKGVVVRLNTPGGTIVGSQKLADELRDLFKAKEQKPVYYHDELVASGGLWASQSLQENYVVGSPYGQTGSIGVILTLPNFQGLADKVGYSETVIKSSESKDLGSPLRPVAVSERAFLQGQVDKNYNEFVGIVATGRKLNTSKVREFANGFVYDNQQAKEFGLIDELGNEQVAIKKVAELKNISNYDVLEIKTPESPLAWLQAKVEGYTPPTPFALQGGQMYLIDTYRM
jgi:protease IV